SEVAEKQKRTSRSKFFSHEKQRRRRRKQQNCHCQFHLLRISQLCDPLPERTVSDLIMILQKRYEAARRQISARLTASCAITKSGHISLIAVALGKTPSQMPHCIRVVGVVSVFLSRHQHMQRVMNIVVPLRVITRCERASITAQVARGVVGIFQNQMHVPSLIKFFPYRGCKFGENVWSRIIVNGMHGV